MIVVTIDLFPLIFRFLFVLLCLTMGVVSSITEFEKLLLQYAVYLVGEGRGAIVGAVWCYNLKAEACWVDG